MKTRIDFIIIGAQKSGTTTLSFLLKNHPEISFCHRKEPAFFIKDEWENGLKEYHSLFEFSDDKKLGEASTMYTFLPEFENCAKNIFEYNPNIKLIYILRNPIARIESHYSHRKLRGRESGSIDEAVLQNEIYLNVSKYASQIENYLNYFSKDQIFISTFEELVSQPKDVLFQICDFLDISFKYFDSYEALPKENQSINSRQTNDLGLKISRIPILNFFPYRIKNFVKRFFSGKLKSKEYLSANSVQWVNEKLKDEKVKLNKIFGVNVSLWD